MLDKVIYKNFKNLLVNSLNSQQINHLGNMIDGTFDLFQESGFGKTIPIPRVAAAETLLSRFDTEENIADLFAVLLKNEGARFFGTELRIHGAIPFAELLKSRKWIYDTDLGLFFRDPFYEKQINFLSSIRVIDLRKEEKLEQLISSISEIAKTMHDKDIEWSINLRLFDLSRDINKLIETILRMLLSRQQLQDVSFHLFTCLRELAVNATKANYKILFEKAVTIPMGITADRAYTQFMKLFKEEIADHGNSRLVEMARSKDQYINVTFQSTNTGIAVWVINNQNCTLVEKRAILKKLGYVGRSDMYTYADPENSEGAGLGIALILTILREYSSDPVPLKVVFFPQYLKMGFFLQRDEIIAAIEKKRTAAQDESASGVSE